GWQVVAAYDERGVETARTSFRVDCRSEIRDAGNRFGAFFDTIHHVLEMAYAERRLRSFDGEKSIRKQCITSRGTWTGAQGGRYFFDHIKDSSDYFTENATDNGMVWDFGMPVDKDKPYHMEWRWSGEFHRRGHNDAEIFARQPIMNDVEHQYINGLFLAWQVSGDDAWMARHLDTALKAVEYTRNSPYTWSEKFQLIHRPFTLDLWDFQSDFDSALVGGDHMNAIPGVSQYGVFYGDNLSMAFACRNLAKMLRVAGREAEAARMQAFGDELFARVAEISWNGRFYQMHVPEDPTFERDFGIDETEVVSLSNPMVANYGIGHEKAKAIIETYRRIREELPENHRAEFMTMWPHFPRGFHLMPGVYLNGAVAGIVAGELARAAFAHGYEAYGADVLRRYWELVEPYAPYIEGGMLAFDPVPPERAFSPVDLRALANAHWRSDDTHDGWMGEKGNDLRNLPTGRNTFESVEFDLLEPEANGGRACLRLARDREGFAEEVTIPVGAKAASLYFLHGAGGGGSVVGELEWRYADGTSSHLYLQKGRQVLGTWNPEDPRPRRSMPEVTLGWVGGTEVFSRIGLTLWGWNNPRPEKEIAALTLRASRETGPKWGVAGITLSDHPVWLPPRDVFEGPNQYWSASCVACALGEGLAGVVDRDRAMRSVRIKPGWLAAGVDEATACIKYEESGAYVRYRYRRDGGSICLDIAASGGERLVEILLPEGAEPRRLSVNGAPAEYDLREIERSRYVSFEASGLDALAVEVELADPAQDRG
ncbi:MAG: hypothetical protein ACLFSZ_11540, partial [Puniceicoccaceae bacterium]